MVVSPTDPHASRDARLRPAALRATLARCAEWSACASRFSREAETPNPRNAKARPAYPANRETLHAIQSFPEIAGAFKREICATGDVPPAAASGGLLQTRRLSMTTFYTYPEPTPLCPPVDPCNTIYLCNKLARHPHFSSAVPGPIRDSISLVQLVSVPRYARTIYPERYVTFMQSNRWQMRRIFFRALFHHVQIIWPIFSGIALMMIGLGLLIGYIEEWSISDALYFTFVTG